MATGLVPGSGVRKALWVEWPGWDYEKPVFLTAWWWVGALSLGPSWVVLGLGLSTEGGRTRNSEKHCS